MSVSDDFLQENIPALLGEGEQLMAAGAMAFRIRSKNHSRLYWAAVTSHRFITLQSTMAFWKNRPKLEWSEVLSYDLAAIREIEMGNDPVGMGIMGQVKWITFTFSDRADVLRLYVPSKMGDVEGQRDFQRLLMDLQSRVARGAFRGVTAPEPGQAAAPYAGAPNAGAGVPHAGAPSDLVQHAATAPVRGHDPPGIGRKMAGVVVMLAGLALAGLGVMEHEGGPLVLGCAIWPIGGFLINGGTKGIVSMVFGWIASAVLVFMLTSGMIEL